QPKKLRLRLHGNKHLDVGISSHSGPASVIEAHQQPVSENVPEILRASPAVTAGISSLPAEEVDNASPASVSGATSGPLGSSIPSAKVHGGADPVSPTPTSLTPSMDRTFPGELDGVNQGIPASTGVTATGNSATSSPQTGRVDSINDASPSSHTPGGGYQVSQATDTISAAQTTMLKSAPAPVDSNKDTALTRRLQEAIQGTEISLASIGAPAGS
ncbi:hypothetical protein MPER_15241, partial [Moniliophthora perniciosa FA553]